MAYLMLFGENAWPANKDPQVSEKQRDRLAGLTQKVRVAGSSQWARVASASQWAKVDSFVLLG